MTSSSAAYTDSRARMASKTLITGDAPQAPPASLQDDAAFLNGVLLAVDDNGACVWCARGVRVGVCWRLACS